MQEFRNKLYRSKQVHAARIRRWHAHPFGVPIAFFVALLLASGITLGVLSLTHRTAAFQPSESHIVIISHDAATQVVPTREQTVGALLKKLNIPISTRDRVEPALDTTIVQDNFRVNIYRAVPLTITDGITTTNIYSAAATPRSAVAQAGLLLYSEDRVTSEPADNLVEQRSLGGKVIIARSTPVNMEVYGNQLSLRTQAKTVGELLKAKNIKLSRQDTVTPAESTPIVSNMQVLVVRNGIHTETETQTVAPPTQFVTDASLTFGTTAVRQAGIAGTQVLTYEVNRQNGVIVSRTLIQTVVTVQPVAQIVARGQTVSIPADKAAVMAQAGIASSDYGYVDYIISHESGWCPTKLQGHPGACPGYPPDVIPSGLGYGLGQATPGTKMSGFGADWKTSAVTQLRWATSYAVGRYGSWGAAYDHWVSHHNW